MNYLSLVCALLAMVSNSQISIIAPKYSSGEQPVYYNGKNSTSVASNPGVVMKGDFTVSAWVYRTQKTKDWARVIGKGAPSTRNYGLWIDSNGSVLSQVYCLRRGGGAENKKIILPMNEWSLLTAVFKKDKYHNLYVDGELVSTRSTAGTPCVDTQPLTVGKAGFHTGFIGLIKKAQLYNYAMTEAQLDTIEEDVPLTHVVDWLGRLILEAQQEIKEIKIKKALAETEVVRLDKILRDKIAKEESAKELLVEKSKLLNAAVIDRDTKCGNMKDTVPGLKKEVETFGKVITALKGLKNGKSLLEEQKTNVSAFISLEDQADPKKVDTVITLVEGLVISAQKQIEDLTTTCSNANKEVVRLQNVVSKARGDWINAVSQRTAAEKLLETAKGKLSSIEGHAAKRIPQLETEIQSLEDAIDLIQSVQ